MTTVTRDLADVFAAIAMEQAAVFLDFDGVLVDLAERPDAIVVKDDLPVLLGALEQATGCAVAIVTGREVRDLRRYLPVTPINVIGSHGAEFQLAGVESTTHPMTGTDAVHSVQAAVQSLSRLKGVTIEFKPTGAVAHYRQAPDDAAEIKTACEAIADVHPGFECHAAKCAYELRPDDVGKDRAVQKAMSHPPFNGRTPIYFGDDTTDEPALAWVNAQGGLAVKVGEGESAAPHHIVEPKVVHALLENWLCINGGRL